MGYCLVVSSIRFIYIEPPDARHITTVQGTTVLCTCFAAGFIRPYNGYLHETYNIKHGRMESRSLTITIQQRDLDLRSQGEKLELEVLL
jgi:hypothetical protein